MDTLHAETCHTHTKIAKFVKAARHHFANPIVSPIRGKKSKQQSRKMVHNPDNSQPCHTVHSSMKKGKANNRQPHQSIATSCRDRSPTPHPHEHENTAHSSMNRCRENTMQSHQPKPLAAGIGAHPHPHEHCNICVRTLSKSTNKSLQMDVKSSQVDAIQTHQSSPYSAENSSSQDHFSCIPGPSTSNHAKPSHIPIFSNILLKNITRNNKDKPQICHKGLSSIPIPQCRKRHIIKTTNPTQILQYQNNLSRPIANSITEDSACNPPAPQNATKNSACSLPGLPYDTPIKDNACNLSRPPSNTATKNNACNNQGNTKTNTQDQHQSVTIQPMQYKTPKLTMKSPLLPTPPSQNIHHHRKQCIPRSFSATNSKTQPPLLPNPTNPRPQHIARSKQWSALLPAPVHSRPQTMTNSNQQPPLSSTILHHYTIPAYYGADTKEPYHILLYLPVIILTITDKFTNLMCQQHHQNTNHQKQYVHTGTQTDLITLLWRSKPSSNIQTIL